MEVKIRLNNTKLGITTVWSLQKFEAKLMHMREMYQVIVAFHTGKMSKVLVFKKDISLTCRLLFLSKASRTVSVATKIHSMILQISGKKISDWIHLQKQCMYAVCCSEKYSNTNLK
jgi:hypothetical protein